MLVLVLISNPVTSLAVVEQELATCGANYPGSLTDRKLESFENQLKMNDGKLDESEKLRGQETK
jgi:hypothetical protein